MPLWLPPRPPQFRKRVTPDANVVVTSNCSLQRQRAGRDGLQQNARVCNVLKRFANVAWTGVHAGRPGEQLSRCC